MWKLKEREPNHWLTSPDRRESSNERSSVTGRGSSRYPILDIESEREGSRHESALAKYKRENDRTGGSLFHDRDSLRSYGQDISLINEREAYASHTRRSIMEDDLRSRRNDEELGPGSFRRKNEFSPNIPSRRSRSPNRRWSKERDSRSREYNKRSRSRSRSGGHRRPSSGAGRRDSRRRSPPTSYRRRSPAPRSGSRRSSRSKDRESSGGRESSSATRSALYLSQAPSNIVVMRNIPPHCGEEDIRQEVEMFGAPVKDIRLVRKGGILKDPDILVSSSSSSISSAGSKTTRGSSPSTSSVWAYLEFLRLEDAQRWMEQSQGRLRIRGDWVEMMYDEPESVSYARDREYTSSSSSLSRRRRRSRSPVSRSRSRSTSRRRVSHRSPPSERSRPSRRMSPESGASGSRRSGESYRPPKDWDCFNCNGRNYPRRLECYRCGVSREESEKSRSDLSLLQITSRPTKYLVIRELDPLTTDETLQLNLTRMSPVFVRQAYVSRDPVLQVSNGYAYVELNNESEAEKLKTYLEQKKFAIDSKRVSVHYSKSCGDEGVKSLHGSSHAPTLYNEPKNIPQPLQNFENEEELKKNPLIQAAHSDYVTNGGAASDSPKRDRNRKEPNGTDVTDAYSSSASSQPESSAVAAAVTETVNVNGQLYPVFPVPNTALYMYDQNSGYYYDPQTMLYYDANTRYYYNSTTQQFLYWDGHYSTYLPLSAQQQEAAKNQQTSSSTDSSKAVAAAAASGQSNSESHLGENRGSVSFSISTNSKKPDKSHNVAKKVREDMERWTKSINSLKKMETPRARLQLSEEGTSAALSGTNNANSESSSTWGSSGAIPSSIGSTSSLNSGSADAAFAALEKRNMLGGVIDQENLNDSPYDPNAEFKKVLLDPKPATALSPFSGIRDEDHLSANDNTASSLSSSAYQKSSTQQSAVTSESEELRLTDWSKLACLLCKRQFKDRDTLIKHQKLSDMHKSNMEAHMKKAESSSIGSISQQNQPDFLAGEDSLVSMLQYRDRAKERREKHGISAPPLREHEKATSSASIAQSAPEKPIGRKNVGNKLMQAMGWKEGEGLGRSKQGITAPISATGRDTTAGLGSNVYTRDPNKTYAENARQALLSRIKNDM